MKSLPGTLEPEGFSTTPTTTKGYKAERTLTSRYKPLWGLRLAPWTGVFNVGTHND